MALSDLLAYRTNMFDGCWNYRCYSRYCWTK